MSLPPVILLHGCGGSPEQAFEQTGWLAALEGAGRDVRALRLPGHGRDNPPHDPTAYADLVGSLLGDLPEEPCDIVGFSLGAKLALDIAARFPERVRRMILGGIGDNAFAPEAIGEAAARALENGPDENTPAPVRSFLATWDPSLNDPLAIAAVLRRPPNPILTEEQVALLKLPVAVVNGMDDPVGRIGTRLTDALGIEPVLLRDIGHFDLTAQAAFRALAVEFLAAGRPADRKEIQS